jgi:Adenylate and Guanylate cyclase catalytic domain/Double zinc ribbon
MRCPRCDADTPDGTKLCIECGASRPPRCPRCGAAIPPRAKFWGECGTPLTASNPAPPSMPPPSPRRYTPGYLAEKILTTKAALEGERKQVTVLFADLKGSMELLADRDPEEARAILDPVLERMTAAVHRYEGTMNQVMSDGIIALFGAPTAHDDHAVRACYAALALQAALRQYSDEVRRLYGLPVDFRVGLNAENPHQPTRQRERRMQGFKSPGHAQRFRSAHGPVASHFRPRRHRLPARAYHQEMTRRFHPWREITGTAMAA